MGKNDYLSRQKAAQDAIMRAAERLTEQYMEDTLEITMHRMGWGYERMCRLLTEWEKIRREYSVALRPSDPEADVAQEHIDAEIRDICKGKSDIMPFVERYPELKKISYEGRKR